MNNTNYKIASIYLPKKDYTLENAKSFLKHHGYKINKVDDENNYFKFRQLSPRTLRKYGFFDYKSKQLGKTGILLIIAYKDLDEEINNSKKKGIMEGSGQVFGTTNRNRRRVIPIQTQPNQNLNQDDISLDVDDFYPTTFTEESNQQIRESVPTDLVESIKKFKKIRNKDSTKSIYRDIRRNIESHNRHASEKNKLRKDEWYPESNQAHLRRINQKYNNAWSSSSLSNIEPHHERTIRFIDTEKSMDNDTNGGGFINNPINYIADRYNQAKDFIINGSRQFSMKVKNILAQVGNLRIYTITIFRSPINSMITNILQLASLQNIDYDQLFHLGIIFNNKVLLEKNSIINMDINPKLPRDTEFINMQYNQSITINQFINNALNYMGLDRFFSYQSGSNNCQDFCLGLLIANEINDDSLNTFIKQDVSSIFANNAYLRRFTNNITDVHGRLTTLNGGKFRKTVRFH